MIPIYADARNAISNNTIISEFRDVVFEDVVLDNNRFSLLLYLDFPNIGPHNYYYQTPHPQTPHA